jgi:hypothetical protein
VQRLRAREGAKAEGFRRIQLEIASEMAGALGRAGDKVDRALLLLEALGHEIDETVDPMLRAEKVAAFNAQREVARRALWELTVHREALGLRDNARLAAYYPIPPQR